MAINVGLLNKCLLLLAMFSYLATGHMVKMNEIIYRKRTINDVDGLAQHHVEMFEDMGCFAGGHAGKTQHKVYEQYKNKLTH